MVFEDKKSRIGHEPISIVNQGPTRSRRMGSVPLDYFLGGRAGNEFEPYPPPSIGKLFATTPHVRAGEWKIVEISDRLRGVVGNNGSFVDRYGVRRGPCALIIRFTPRERTVQKARFTQEGSVSRLIGRKCTAGQEVGHVRGRLRKGKLPEHDKQPEPDEC